MQSRMIMTALLGLILVSQAANAAQQSIRLEPLSETVRRFEKIEFNIHLGRRYRNPFDPAEADLSLEIALPSGKRLTLPAFYYQDFERKLIPRGKRKEEWLYPSGAPTWKARFAPSELGKHSCRARLRDRSGKAVSESVSFECVPSDSKGFIKLSRKDPRFLEFTDGTPFFPIGHNLAFLYYGQYLRDTETIEAVFRKMTENGANFARVWAGCGDWAMAIEWRKSAWGRTWERGAHISLMPGNPGRLWDKKCVEISGAQGTTLPVSPCCRVGLKPNTRYVVSGSTRTTDEAGLEIAVGSRKLTPILHSVQGQVSPSKKWTKFEREFTTSEDEWRLGRMILKLTGKGTAWLADMSLKETPDGPELLWEADVNRPVMGDYNLLDSFLLDKTIEAAERSDLYLQICLLSNPTRDLYMARLRDVSSPEYAEAIAHAKRIFRYAVARWGYSTSVAAWEYFNEMNPGLLNDRFYDEVGKYIEQVDIYHHPLTTSAWRSNPKDWRHPKLDIANEHFYIRPGKGETWKDEVAAILERARFLRQKTPPNKPAMIAELGLATKDWRQSPYMNDDTKLAHFHNSLWASALSGLSGTAMFWWWEALDRMNAYEHYKPLSAFLKTIPFTRGDLREAETTVSDKRVRVVGLQGNDCAYLWLFNSEANWYSAIVEKKTPSEVKGMTVQIKGLAAETYRIQWWDTHAGKATRREDAAVKEGELRLEPPTFLTDIACRVVR